MRQGGVRGGVRLLGDDEVVAQAKRAKKVATKPKKESRAKTENGREDRKGEGVSPVVAVVAMSPSPSAPAISDAGSGGLWVHVEI